MAGASAKAVDFSGIEDKAGGNFSPRRVPTGDYAAKIVKVEDAKSKGDGEFMYLFTIKLTKYSQNSYPFYCKLAENQLWKLRNLLIAAGLNVPKKRMKLDPNKVVGKSIGVTMEDDDEYKGKIKSVVQAVFPIAELAEGSEVGDDEDEPEMAADVELDDEIEPTVSTKKGKTKKDKAGKKGKKKKGGEDLEELNLDDIDD